MLVVRLLALGRSTLWMRRTRLVLSILLSAVWKVVISLAGRLSTKFIALDRTMCCFCVLLLVFGRPTVCTAGLSAVNSTLLVIILVLARWPNSADPLVPAQLISVMTGQGIPVCVV